MKKNLFYAVLFFIVSFASCKKDNNNENESQGTIQFGLSAQQQQTKQKCVSTSEVPASIVITIADSKGKVAIESKKIALFNMNGRYISESLSLVIGNYNITKFLVLNNFDSLIYATPLKGSNLAYLVTTPLPIAFNISKNNVTEVVPEVLSVESFKPEDFGYYSFSFDVVKTFDFLITVMVYNFSIKNWELTTANIIIRAADSTIAYNGTLSAVTNQITLRDNSTIYFLSVSKVGYQIYTAIFTADEMKLYFKSEDKGPLIISLNSESVTDIDGNVYHTVVIGTQTWMAENLKTTKYNDGTDIPLVTDNTVWSSLTTPAYCCYNNDVSTYKTIYGGLYNWYVVDAASNGGKNVCPTGWHVPDIGEWGILWYPFKVDYNPDPLTVKIGKELMETGTTHWIKPWGTNETGFTALPGGDRSYTGIYSDIGENATFWSSTMWPGEDASDRFPIPISESYGSSPMSMAASWKEGMSIRCLKDN
jgi:uncharacterized protein (TIGR02145 family)